MKELKRFTENFSIDSRLFRKAELTDSLREKINSNKKLTESFAMDESKTIWEVPISMYDVENANGRIYSKALWENVINNQRHVWEGSPMLSNHPAGDSDGSPSDICGVWLDARIDESDGYVYGKFIPSGSNGKEMEDHLGNGLRAGTSSSGFGELARDGKTVEASSYQIERLSDWVLNPSQGTFFTYEAKKGPSMKENKDSIKESTNNKLEEGAPSVKISKLEEKKFRKDIEAFLEDTNQIEDPHLKLAELEEILTYFNEGVAPELKEKVEAKLVAEKEAIAAKIKDNEILKEELGIENTNDLKEKLGKIASEVDILKEDALDWQAVSAKLQEKILALKERLSGRPTEAYVEHLRDRNKKLFSENNTLNGKIVEETEYKTTLEETKKEVLDKLQKTISKYKETITYLEDENKTTAEKLSEALKTKEDEIATLKTKIEEAESDFGKFKENLNKSVVTRGSDVIKPFVNFKEDTEIDNYWADLVLRHGIDIKPFEERIRGTKTLKESMAVYMKVLPVLNESAEYYDAKLNESVSLGRKERGKILESKGMKLDKSFKKLPKGWQ